MLKFLCVLVLGVLNFTTLFSQEIESDKEQYNKFFKITFDTTNVDKLLDDWKTDSVACLKLRSKLLAGFLVRKLDLQDKTQAEILQILGPPNVSLLVAKVGEKKGKFTGLRYYYSSFCPDNMPFGSSFCWLELLVNNKTKKVQFITTGCH